MQKGRFVLAFAALGVLSVVLTEKIVPHLVLSATWG